MYCNVSKIYTGTVHYKMYINTLIYWGGMNNKTNTNVLKFKLS